MKRVRAELKRVVGMFAGGRRDAELVAELESHVQMHIEEKVRAGMSARVVHGAVHGTADVGDASAVPGESVDLGWVATRVVVPMVYLLNVKR